MARLKGWIGVRLSESAKRAMQHRAERQGLKMAFVVRRIIERVASEELDAYPHLRKDAK